MSKVGVVVVGLHGAVATTLVAGVALMVKGLAPRIGMVTEKGDARISETITNLLPFAPLEDLVFGGWDVRFENVYQGAVHHKVLPPHVLTQVEAELSAVQAWPAVFGRKYAENVVGENTVKAKSYRDEIAQVTRDIDAFKEKNGLDRVVMVNLASTEAYMEVGPVHTTLDAFEAGLDRDDPAISPGMRYFYAALKKGIPFANFTPSLTHVPALAELSAKTQAPYAGMDGKTGQTLLKTALAAMMRVRRLHIDGWYSTNVLGNSDGAVLASPESNKTKVLSKAAVLDSIVGYQVDNHQVHIHYYKPRGDAKEAWDNIDIVGFAGVPMQIKVNFLCQDSVLAAPLVVDLVRLLDVAKRTGDFGPQRQLSLFFKSPHSIEEGDVVHDLFKQEQMLLQWVKARAAKLTSNGARVEREATA